LRSCNKSYAAIKPPRLNMGCHWRNLQLLHWMALIGGGPKLCALVG
jgi:hypothetical protein